MLNLTMNTAAAEALATLHELSEADQPASLLANMRKLRALGIESRGQVLTWVNHNARVPAESAPGSFANLTEWEVSYNWVPLEGFIGIHSRALYGPNAISDGQQALLLRHGVAFMLWFPRLLRALETQVPVRCILGGSPDSVAFRFHQIRPGEQWDPTGPWSFNPEKLIVADIEPATV